MTEHSQIGPHRTTPSETETQSMGGCLTRVAWMMAAPLTLLILAAVLARGGRGPWSLESIAYLGVVLATLAVRYLDIFRYGGQTKDGAPASKADWRRYLVGFPAVALVGWGAALFLGET